jgi:hypothetical protein
MIIFVNITSLIQKSLYDVFQSHLCVNNLTVAKQFLITQFAFLYYSFSVSAFQLFLVTAFLRFNILSQNKTLLFLFRKSVTRVRDG